jgi:transposase
MTRLFRGLRSDDSPIAAALVETLVHGQAEDQIKELKLVKRQMYGLAKLDLLRARLLGVAESTGYLHQD